MSSEISQLPSKFFTRNPFMYRRMLDTIINNNESKERNVILFPGCVSVSACVSVSVCVCICLCLPTEFWCPTNEKLYASHRRECIYKPITSSWQRSSPLSCWLNPRILMPSQKGPLLLLLSPAIGTTHPFVPKNAKNFLWEHYSSLIRVTPTLFIFNSK